MGLLAVTLHEIVGDAQNVCRKFCTVQKAAKYFANEIAHFFAPCVQIKFACKNIPSSVAQGA